MISYIKMSILYIRVCEVMTDINTYYLEARTFYSKFVTLHINIEVIKPYIYNVFCSVDVF